jgi:hypothetical protein
VVPSLHHCRQNSGVAALLQSGHSAWFGCRLNGAVDIIKKEARTEQKENTLNGN